MKNKINSYQRLKNKYEKEIQELTNDIYALVDEKDFNLEIQVRMKWKLRLASDSQVWLGDASKIVDKVYFDGILNRLKDEHK